MNHNRRDLAILLPLLAARPASAAKERLPSKCFPFNELPVKENAQNKSRAVLNGATHSGYPLEMHITELAPGMMPHAPHSHVHEELLLIREGQLEVTIAGKMSRLGPGSVAYLASNQEHGWKNVGSAPARYFVLALGDDKA